MPVLAIPFIRRQEPRLLNQFRSQTRAGSSYADLLRQDCWKASAEMELLPLMPTSSIVRLYLDLRQSSRQRSLLRGRAFLQSIRSVTAEGLLLTLRKLFIDRQAFDFRNCGVRQSPNLRRE
jgi:hypothetical protein